jgi:hypothetical protein
MKRCNGCATDKPLSAFWLDRKRGLPKSRCKECSTATAREWRLARPGYERTRYQQNRVETRERHLVRKYGVTLADYDTMLVAQHGRCAICLTTEDTQSNGVFHVDHCHQTGRVRGLLCRGCNHLLGAISDDPAALQRAIDYLVVPQIPEAIGRAIMTALEPAQRRGSWATMRQSERDISREAIPIPSSREETVDG